MKKTNSFKLAMVAVGMLTIGTVSAQTTAVDNKGTIKTLKVENGISEIKDTATNTTTYKLGGALTEATTIATDAQVGGTNTINITGIKKADIATELPSVTAAGATTLNIGLTAAGLPVIPVVATDNLTGLSLMVRDEATGEIKKLLAEDAAKFLSFFNPAKVSIREEGTATTAAPTFAVAGLLVADVAANPAGLFVYKNGVKLRLGTDFTVVTDGQIDIDAAVVNLGGLVNIEVQFTK
ncbi:hypothetical protein [Tenacibaculum finnmarkense]|nr:hypothetical protein [Tenacibaculum finnmarkense]MCG8206419.1 hypothetical protein [Tenacibaculum finnmarkense genomovar finnmarkense]MCG8722463.1 hypothetical protein [Tenacibaculum finnmarkense]MCG8740787.1 hypothetical protein [Tenacibaculum finnmarkense]MCG8764153.1 hypothetical protein [Tenacibaculum finnmarkense]MCG8777053.1 hypothetical protein [Tenacibaculum finnmarkense]